MTQCAHPGRELRAFEAAARNLSALLQLPLPLGDAMGDAVRRRFFEFKGTPRACARRSGGSSMALVRRLTV